MTSPESPTPTPTGPVPEYWPVEGQDPTQLPGQMVLPHA